MKKNHLKILEDEAIYILREVAAQFERPAMLFSGGKDSICMAWLARKAFYPGKSLFPCFMWIQVITLRKPWNTGILS